jgi:hypothetical protein
MSASCSPRMISAWVGLTIGPPVEEALDGVDWAETDRRRCHQSALLPGVQPATEAGVAPDPCGQLRLCRALDSGARVRLVGEILGLVLVPPERYRVAATGAGDPAELRPLRFGSLADLLSRTSESVDPPSPPPGASRPRSSRTWMSPTSRRHRRHRASRSRSQASSGRLDRARCFRRGPCGRPLVSAFGPVELRMAWCRSPLARGRGRARPRGWWDRPAPGARGTARSPATPLCERRRRA